MFEALALKPTGLIGYDTNNDAIRNKIELCLISVSIFKDANKKKSNTNGTKPA